MPLLFCSVALLPYARPGNHGPNTYLKPCLSHGQSLVCDILLHILTDIHVSPYHIRVVWLPDDSPTKAPFWEAAVAKAHKLPRKGIQARK